MVYLYRNTLPLAYAPGEIFNTKIMESVQVCKADSLADCMAHIVLIKILNESSQVNSSTLIGLSRY